MTFYNILFAGGPQLYPTDYLLVGGGGGGGSQTGGGAGAGGLLTGSFNLVKGTYTIVIGAGGVGGTSPSTQIAYNGQNGGNSTFNGLIAYGGGGGPGTNPVSNPSGNLNGLTSTVGGSGGAPYASKGFPGTGIAGQGYDGGTAVNIAAGGGGAGGNTTDGTGGIGVASSISGTSTYYAGGGGGGGQNNSGTQYAGGLGGGGTGRGTGSAGSPGTTNTGGGGGGGGQNGSNGRYAGGAGGSGIFIIRYPNYLADASSTTGSPTYSNTGGYKIYTFTGSGSITL